MVTGSSPARPSRLAIAAALIAACVFAGGAQAAVDFGAPTTTALGNEVNDLAAVDLTGDGVMDLVATGNTSLAVLRGTGGGVFVPGAVATVPAFSAAVTTGDFNGDGKADAAAASSKANVV